MARKSFLTWYGIATKTATRSPNGTFHRFWDTKLQTIRQVVSLRSFQTAGSITWISIYSIYFLQNNLKIISGENISRKFESACFLSSEIPNVPYCKTSTCHPINASTVFILVSDQTQLYILFHRNLKDTLKFLSQKKNGTQYNVFCLLVCIQTSHSS